ncbi:MAG: sigma-54-dependent Fis family transcriptional regulator [Deltaproteobacteria bacterium]|nr:sigma-54-dependent Fis family transcriptional regulator [Deltaproteobacteria bacterium]
MKKLIVLIVDDDPCVRQALRLILKGAYETIEAQDGFEALQIVKSRNIDIVLLDVMMPGMDGIAALGKIKEADPDAGVIMLSARDTAKEAVTALHKGAYDYVVKPFDSNDLLMTIKRYAESLTLKTELAYLKEETWKDYEGLGGIVSIAPGMKSIFELIEKVSNASSNVLITGESGTGKELVARAIHSMGNRRNKPFVAVNCGAVPSELMESELFGHEKGAFTGAHARKIGKLEFADNGTVFFDEVSTLPMHLQIKLLRVIQERTFERIGSNLPINVDIRFIAATNVNLDEAVTKGAFREDLFYRLKVVPIELPPLRERKEDIPVLVKHFLEKHGAKCNKNMAGISDEAVAALSAYHWPGNVRELENLIERLVVLSKDGSRITYEDLPKAFFSGGAQWRAHENGSFHDAIKAFERRYISNVLDKTNWNRRDAARILNIHRNTLLMKMKTLGLKAMARLAK